MKPRLSVIVICLNSSRALNQSLEALAPQVKDGHVEVLVVGRCADWSSDSVKRSRYPGLTWISGAKESNVPQLRSLGIQRSRGDIVALLEDDCVVTEGWCCSVIRAHESPSPVIGGAVAPGLCNSLLDWAVFFSEYGRFMPPLDGIVPALPGNNVSYKRPILNSAVEDTGFEEVFFHQRLRQAGTKLIADPGLVVTNVNHRSWRHVTTVPLHHGRTFAATRSAGFSSPRKLLYGVLITALPPIKVARVAREALGRPGGYTRQFVRSLPWTCLFMACWAGGEALGYLFGGGDSARRWR